MVAPFLSLLLIAILVGAGFVLKWLFVAAVLALLWLIAFFARSEATWYRW